MSNAACWGGFVKGLEPEHTTKFIRHLFSLSFSVGTRIGLLLGECNNRVVTDPELESLDIIFFPLGINKLIDTRETSEESTIKGAFLTVAGKEAFTLRRTLVYTKTLRDTSIVGM